MKLSKELSDKIKYDLPAEVVEMRFELFDWLKEKGLSVSVPYRGATFLNTIPATPCSVWDR